MGAAAALGGAGTDDPRAAGAGAGDSEPEGPVAPLVHTVTDYWLKKGGKDRKM
jgi:hypothetical protein